MGTSGRNACRQNEGEIRDQDILKVFDFETTVEDPSLTVSEVAEALATHWGIEVTDEAVRTRLEQMRDDDTISKRELGPGVAYRALVGPELADDVEATLEETEGELEAGETTSHDDLWADADEN
jgi:hypothetical protein